MVAYHRAALIALVSATAACGILDPFDGPQGELDENRELWEATRPATYAMVIERSCFCPPEVLGPVRVTVQGTMATNRIYTDSGEVVPEELAHVFPTVGGLFDVLVDAYDRDAHEVRVTYDEATGIPVDVWIDYEETMVDEEQGFTVVMPIDTDPGA